MEREPDDDDAMDPARARRIARNRQNLKAVAENERASRKGAAEDEHTADVR